MTIPPLAHTNLFKPIKVGRYQLQNRVVFPPLTRMRNDADQCPTEMAVEYYAQRSSAPGTLLITEATFITPGAGGYDAAPGIWSAKQIAAWSKVFEGIHAKKCIVFVQLWHLGRASNAEALKKRGLDFVSSSPIYMNEHEQKLAEAAHNPIRALTVDEIHQTVKDYATAAVNAIEAGADGVEIHSANGYLLDQFIQACSNQRTDEYGGSIENRCRIVLEVVDAVVAAVGADRTGIRFSPFGLFQSMGGAASNPEPVFSYLLEQLERRAQSGQALAYVHLVEPRTATLFSGKEEAEGDNSFALSKWSGPLIRAGGYASHYDVIEKDVNHDDRTLIGIGRPFIANPDLPRRLAEGLPLNTPDRSTFYASGPKGYTDYPFHE